MMSVNVPGLVASEDWLLPSHLWELGRSLHVHTSEQDVLLGGVTEESQRQWPGRPCWALDTTVRWDMGHRARRSNPTRHFLGWVSQTEKRRTHLCSFSRTWLVSVGSELCEGQTLGGDVTTELLGVKSRVPQPAHLQTEHGRSLTTDTSLPSSEVPLFSA